MELRHLERLCAELDELQGRLEELDAQGLKRLAELRGRFVRLTLESLERRELAPQVLRALERLEGSSRTHSLFFLALAQIVRLKHGLG